MYRLHRPVAAISELQALRKRKLEKCTQRSGLLLVFECGLRMMAWHSLYVRWEWLVKDIHFCQELTERGSDWWHQSVGRYSATCQVGLQATKWRRKPAGIDMEWNYVTVTLNTLKLLCPPAFSAKHRTIHIRKMAALHDGCDCRWLGLLYRGTPLPAVWRETQAPEGLHLLFCCQIRVMCYWVITKYIQAVFFDSQYRGCRPL